jgi:phospholipase C
MMPSRRNFLKTAAMLTGAAGFAAGLPDAVRKAYAIAPDPGTTWEDAEHVVILMQENRSFDHALGTLQGVRGFNDPRAIRQANGNSIFLQTNLDGETFAPWRLDIKDTKITWMGSIPHSRDSQVDAWNQGHHNAWIDAKRSSNPDYHQVPITMGHYTREDIPFYYALADAFTVCDQNYCGAMTSTTPNRSLLWTGTVRDEQKADSNVYMRNPEYRGLSWKTFPERLSEAGVDWKIYQNEVNAADLEAEAHGWLGNVGNVTEAFTAFNVHLTTASNKKIQTQIAGLKKEIKALQQSPIDATMKDDRTTLIEQKQDQLKALEGQLRQNTSIADLSPHEQELHRRAFVTNEADADYHSLETISYEENGRTETMQVPKGDIFYQFRRDVNEGKLPSISWLVPPSKFSDHPAYPWYGAWYLSEAVDILTKNPEVWKKTIFILTYDENDGYFDHGQSYVAADPKNPATGRASHGIDTALEYTYVSDELARNVKPEQARSGPIGLGFRVPMIVASPWSRGGWVNSQLFDQTSTLQFLELYVQKKLGKTVQETNLSEWRRTVCGDLTSCFHPANLSVPQLPVLGRDKHLTNIERAKFREVPTNYKKLSAQQIARYNEDSKSYPNAARQEPGIRPSNALPYELFCEGTLDEKGEHFQLVMHAGNSVHGARSAGAPFNVYLRNTAKSGGVLPRGENNENMLVATYVVKAGDTLREEIPVQLFAHGRYEIEVHAPNGFYRVFRGSSSPSPVLVRCVYDRAGSRLSGNVMLQAKNTFDKSIRVTVTDNGYKSGEQTMTLEPAQAADIALKSSQSHGWYDFTVAVKGSDVTVRYAGRAETGASSFTDPVMGEVAI